MKENVIISLADSNYFELLNELVDSIKRFKESKNTAICIMDAGLKEDQKSFLKKKVDEIKPADWDIDVPDFKVKGREWLKSQVSRAFLPKYFPNYKKYIWIDADCWLNSGSAIKMLIEASNKGYFAISSMGDRDCPGAMIRIDWLFRNMGIVKSQNIKHSFKLGLSTKEARYLGLKPHLNAGVFALDKKSIFWSTWIKNFKKLRGPRYGRAQLAMN